MGTDDDNLAGPPGTGNLDLQVETRLTGDLEPLAADEVAAVYEPHVADCMPALRELAGELEGGDEMAFFMIQNECDRTADHVAMGLADVVHQLEKWKIVANQPDQVRKKD